MGKESKKSNVKIVLNIKQDSNMFNIHGTVPLRVRQYVKPTVSRTRKYRLHVTWILRKKYVYVCGLDMYPMMDTFCLADVSFHPIGILFR